MMDVLQCWLDHGKPIIKQINTPELVFRFLVKFYTPDPELLEEELTRLFPVDVQFVVIIISNNRMFLSKQRVQEYIGTHTRRHVFLFNWPFFWSYCRFGRSPSKLLMIVVVALL